MIVAINSYIMPSNPAFQPTHRALKEFTVRFRGGSWKRGNVVYTSPFVPPSYLFWKQWGDGWGD